MARRLTQLADIPVDRLDGVGPKRAAALAKVDVNSVLDLLTYYPRRYLDRTREVLLGDLKPGEEAMVLVEVVSISSRTARNRRRMVTADVKDSSGRMRVTFFNQPFRERQLPAGTHCVLFGRVELFGGRRQMTNPIVDLVGDRTGRIISIYPQSESAGINTWDVDRWVAEALERAGTFADPVPAEVLARFGLVDRTTAFNDIHRPETMAAAMTARRRLVFDELLRVQIRLVQRKRETEQNTSGVSHVTDGDLVTRFHQHLGFGLTGAQSRAVDEIITDLAAPHPMHRLLQGDVGAGKTVVAVSALLVAVQSGHQGALMAPTEVLAEQHFMSVRRMLDSVTVAAANPEVDLFASAGMDRPVRVELLTNRTTAAERRRLAVALESGEVDILIGTHALIEEGVRFHSLGVVVIDEQHRFGVEQRAALRNKSSDGSVPDVLVMTATPIPRTAAMTVYGDLDVSVLDELPPGRTPIRTVWARTEDEQEEAWVRVRSEVGAGRQAYVVCPLVEESPKLEVASAEETFERLANTELKGLTLGLLHGRVRPVDKEQVMEQFRTGKTDVLVATTVIEVGVDVPNATVMVILDADRFGIAQLHQLRGRVGRGADRSYCFLVADPTDTKGDERSISVARLEAMVRTTDGFELAEIDLDLRGEGTIMGERQKGRNDLKLASLRRDREWVAHARAVAGELVGDDPTLASFPMLVDEVDALLPGDDAADFLFKS